MAFKQVFFGNTAISLTAGNSYRLKASIRLDATVDPSVITRMFLNFNGKIFTEFALVSIIDSGSAVDEVIEIESLYTATINESVNAGLGIETTGSEIILFNIDDFLISEEILLQPDQFNDANVYDLAINEYGNILGFAEFIGQLDSINTNVTTDIIYPEKVFTQFLPNTQIQTRTQKYSYISRTNTSIYDIALQVDGKIEGLSKILSYYDNLDDDLQGQLITLERSKDPIFEEIDRSELLISTL